MTEFGTLLPEETDGTCPNCKSTHIVVTSTCQGCGIERKQCKDCGSTWEEFLKEAVQ
jgi:transposase-like protein